jgi:hypothetical protein
MVEVYISTFAIVMEVITIIATLIGSIGGWEAIKWVLNRKANLKTSEAMADDSEFSVLAKTNVFLQEQLAKKEERFAEQTERLRKLIEENVILTGKVAKLEAERSMKLCNVRACPNREPQSGY